MNITDCLRKYSDDYYTQMFGSRGASGYTQAPVPVTILTKDFFALIHTCKKPSETPFISSPISITAHPQNPCLIFLPNLNFELFLVPFGQLILLFFSIFPSKHFAYRNNISTFAHKSNSDYR